MLLALLAVGKWAFAGGAPRTLSELLGSLSASVAVASLAFGTLVVPSERTAEASGVAGQLGLPLAASLRLLVALAPLVGAPVC